MLKHPPGYYFDEEAADLTVAFFEQWLVHIKGQWAGQHFTLEPWERDDIIRPLFGWKRPDGTRQYRYAFIFIPRKNGKSTLAAGIALYLTFADEEPGAEVYSAAGDRDQAAIVFDLAKHMVEDSPRLDERSQSYKRSIVIPSTRSVYKVLSAEAYTKHGLNASGVVFDELHVQPNRDLWDVLTTATASRSQPLVVAITTAGYDRQSICYEQYEYAKKVRDGIIDDPSYFPYIQESPHPQEVRLAGAGDADEDADEDADIEDNWQDEATWASCNPNLGVSISLDYLRAEAARALQTPGRLNTFLRLHLNRWTSQETRWLPMIDWDLCSMPVDAEALKGKVCYGGLDLASTVDLGALLLAFGPEESDSPDPDQSGEEQEPDEAEEPEPDAGAIQLLPFFWIPEDNLIERARKDRVPYDVWVREGLITATPGNVIDYAYIVDAITRLGEVYNIKEIAFDRWGAFQISQQLEGAGFTMVAFGQGFASMSGPTKELLRLVLNHQLAHGGHPVLRWMADNLMVKHDPAGNVKPDKSKSREKIDGITAGVMALDRLIRHGGQPDSVYETRGLLEI